MQLYNIAAWAKTLNKLQLISKEFGEVVIFPNIRIYYSKQEQTLVSKNQH